MPELPEIETIRLQLTKVLPSLTVKDIEVRKPGVLHGDKKLLIGKKVTELRRYGKMLVIDFTGNTSLAIHLKMSGRIVYEKVRNVREVPFDKTQGKREVRNAEWDTDYPTDKHTHIIFTFTNGSKLYYHDYRRFGWLKLVPTNEVEKIQYARKLGPEFLNNLTIQQFNKTLKKSSRPIKIVFMDQEKFAGVGNIYANDGLWCAKIHPKTKANTLTPEQIVKLFECLEDILKQAIKWGGASENAYRDAFGGKGEVQEHFKVYARANKPCQRCQTPIKKIMLAGRGTYLCPTCQRF